MLCLAGVVWLGRTTRHNAQPMEKDREMPRDVTLLPGLVRPLLAAVAGSMMAAGPAGASEYTERRAVAVQACEKIDSSEAQTGLVMNPDGYRSYYVRSHCLQDAAVRFRDASLCRQVKRRWSMFSSWGISQSSCRKLVDEKTAADRAALQELKRAYVAGAMHLDSLRVEKNGNGRDYDFLPVFSGNYPHGYLLTFEIVPPGSAPVPVHSLGYYVDAASGLRSYVRQSDIRARFPGFEAGRTYAVRATAILSVPVGVMDALWPDAFVENIFPARDRTQTLTVDAQF